LVKENHNKDEAIRMWRTFLMQNMSVVKRQTGRLKYRQKDKITVKYAMFIKLRNIYCILCIFSFTGKLKRLWRLE